MWVGAERMPSLSCGSEKETPGVPRERTKALIPRNPAAGSVLAKSTMVSASAALLMKVLLPLTTQASPSRLATVSMPPMSDPEPGSVRAKAPSAIPDAISGMK